MTTERLTISFDPEKGELVITDGRMISSLGTLVPVMTMSGPADEREELVARFNAARGQWGLPPLPDPDLPTKPPVSDVPLSSSVGTDPLAGKPLRKPPPPKHPASVPQSPSPEPNAAGTVWNSTRIAMMITLGANATMLSCSTNGGPTGSPHRGL
jgi:hypothetical protein